MLRLGVLLLVLANAGYWAWSQGLLASYGLAPAVQTEPQRLGTQIHPESIRLLTPEEVKKLDNGPSASANTPPSECLQAGLFNDQQISSLRPRLEAALPTGSWQLESSTEPARWIVYMGKYTEESLVKKRGELRQLGVAFRAVHNPALAPGLALASFPLQADADKELARIATKGVRTARVVQERAETHGHTLKLAAVDPAQHARLDALKPQFEGKALQPCS
ncbi:SPOR domain-containing protein [Polaromonas sp. SM01]|uniref:SPOR domain-containing protein n=1 Tax=Polaromonas sp. SM01 TaxID=3085630 RepID=UPI0029817C50|nr:SPOR domain-containing protein [Polaromonas sp. SM01]MDW5441111.1 SPOR domain-containing protein [Polaromonas sp. SM01]